MKLKNYKTMLFIFLHDSFLVLFYPFSDQQSSSRNHTGKFITVMLYTSVNNEARGLNWCFPDFHGWKVFFMVGKKLNGNVLWLTFLKID